MTPSAWARLTRSTWQPGGATNATYDLPATLTGLTRWVVPLSIWTMTMAVRGLTSPAYPVKSVVALGTDTQLRLRLRGGAATGTHRSDRPRPPRRVAP